MLAEERKSERHAFLSLLKRVLSFTLDKASLRVHVFLIVIDNGKTPEVSTLRLRKVNFLGA